MILVRFSRVITKILWFFLYLKRSNTKKGKKNRAMSIIVKNKLLFIHIQKLLLLLFSKCAYLHYQTSDIKKSKKVILTFCERWRKEKNDPVMYFEEKKGRPGALLKCSQTWYFYYYSDTLFFVRISYWVCEHVTVSFCLNTIYHVL